MSYALLFLAQNPRHRQQIVDDPKILPGATQELIRYNAFHQIRRIAARDTELLGAQIREGDIVVVPMQAANHDPRKFPDPLTVDFAIEFGRRDHVLGRPAPLHRPASRYAAVAHPARGSAPGHHRLPARSRAAL
jgi:hypothetical protein